MARWKVAVPNPGSAMAAAMKEILSRAKKTEREPFTGPADKPILAAGDLVNSMV